MEIQNICNEMVAPFLLRHPVCMSVGLCGSVLPVQRTFVSTSNSLTLSYHHNVDVASRMKSFNITFTYVAVRHNGIRPIRSAGANKAI